MKRNYNPNIIIAILVFGVLICLWFLLNPGKDHDTHKSDYNEVIAIRDSFNRYEASIVKTIEQKDIFIRQQDSIIKDLMAGQAVVRRDLDRSASQALSLSHQVWKLKQQEIDTSEYSLKIDSLLVEVENLTYLYSEYKAYADSLAAANDNQQQELKSVIMAKTILYNDLRRVHDQISSKYTVLFNDYNGVRKDLKREKLKTKIGALLAIVAGGLMILK